MRRRADEARREALFAECRDDPAKFQRDVLGRQLWSKQIDVCNAIVRNPTTVVPAGRVVGKSWTLAGIVLWWLYTRKPSRVITTGPDFRQVVSVLWSELRKALHNAKEHLPFEHLSEGYANPQRLVINSLNRHEALGFATKTTEGFSGQHSPDLLVICDEASGIESGIWDAIHGLAATRLVICGNPIAFGTHFHELHELAETSKEIKSVGISTLESPDVDKEDSLVGLASASFLRQMREIHGENSPWWVSNILGQFPGEESIRFIDLAWIDACTDPAILDDELWNDYPGGMPWMGVDVGGGVGADRSCICVRDRKRLLELFASDTHGVLDDAAHRLEPVVVEIAKRFKITGDRIIYDKAGIGRNFGSYLANHGLDGAVGSFGAGRGGLYAVNRRTANSFAVKKRLDPNTKGFVPFYCGGVRAWPMLRQELSELRAPSLEMEEGYVKQRLEDKEELRGRLKRSPDHLDAFLMTFSFID